MIDAKVEEFFRVINWIECLVLERVLVTSQVPDPDIVSSFSCHKSRCFISIVYYKSVS